MKVTSREQAWEEVNKIFPTDYEKDETSSRRAGYDIYRHPTLNHYNRICDLGNRLEVLTGEHGENVTNICIEKEEQMKKYKITVFNGDYSLTCEVETVYAAFMCMESLRTELLRGVTIDMNSLMEKLVCMQNGELISTGNYAYNIEVVGVEAE